MQAYVSTEPGDIQSPITREPTAADREIIRNCRLIVDRLGTQTKGVVWKSYTDEVVDVAYSSNMETVTVHLILNPGTVEVFRSGNYDGLIRKCRPGKWMAYLEQVAAAAEGVPVVPEDRRAYLWAPVDDTDLFPEIIQEVA